jgi:hypothetical protein
MRVNGEGSSPVLFISRDSDSRLQLPLEPERVDNPPRALKRAFSEKNPTVVRTLSVKTHSTIRNHLLCYEAETVLAPVCSKGNGQEYSVYLYRSIVKKMNSG